MDYTKYIKYISALTILCAMILHVAGITPWNSILQLCCHNVGNSKPD